MVGGDDEEDDAIDRALLLFLTGRFSNRRTAGFGADSNSSAFKPRPNLVLFFHFLRRLLTRSDILLPILLALPKSFGDPPSIFQIFQMVFHNPFLIFRRLFLGFIVRVTGEPVTIGVVVGIGIGVVVVAVFVVVVVVVVVVVFRSLTLGVVNVSSVVGISPVIGGRTDGLLEQYLQQDECLKQIPVKEITA